MAINLSLYNEIACALLVRITVKNYSTTPGGPYSQQILKFSDSKYPISLNTDAGIETYVGLGNFVNISSAASELRASNGDLTISLAGVPDSAISEMVNSRLKGSKVEIYRVIMDAATGIPYNIDGNPAGRFFGIISNYALTETWESGTSTNIIEIICSSHIAHLENIISGRRTNPYDQALLYPDDLGFTNVPSIINASYDFGGNVNIQ